ncbi:hypothetical protein [Aequorivita sp. CIP111184]|nr:hypothetical protein [Aequorivita sp. CIP111184]SRX54298.1 hypothetical protein AEQU1_01307 [Aequorivita sp. CIP111184]
MGDTQDGFGKERDHNQYGEVEKDENDKVNNKNLPKPPNKGTED